MYALPDSLLVSWQAISETLPHGRKDRPPIDKKMWFQEAVLRTTSFRKSSDLRQVVQKTLQKSLTVAQMSKMETRNLLDNRSQEVWNKLLHDKKSGPSR